jgi:HSP20 family molecular chaperone IbpA
MEVKKKKSPYDQTVNLEKMEQWLKEYFLNPLTSHYDHSQFRIDIYETEEYWIVEGFLDDYDSSEITVKIEESQLIITAQKLGLTYPSPSPKRLRAINFPFSLICHSINATFDHGVLEVFISKKIDNGYGKNRFITLP